MHWMKWTSITIGIAAAVFVIDRLLLWAEDHDWIYYRTRKPSITSLSTALFQMQAIVQPEKQHIVETKREIEEDEDDDGDGKPKPPPTLNPPKS
ncbi:MAG TPA: hypothetical protein VHB97_27115 [Polyangia bacterium]|jgi:hypothetical protein|nr:hypothetical protein [Polyangia bacterium]